MKRLLSLLRTWLLAVPVFLFLGYTPASAQYYMNVLKKNGETVRFEVTELDSVSFTSTEVPAYEYVDLGLSVNWATFNVGATKPEEYGDYYAWGETEPKENYSWSTYKWCNGSSETLTKYNKDSGYGTLDNKTVLDPEDDVAHVKWGDSWRMPTKAEWDELINNCIWTWYDSDNTEFGGVAGYKVTSKINGYTDRFIFLPAAGYRYGTYLNDGGSYGDYWSCSLDTDYPNYAYGLYFYSGLHYTFSYLRDYGFSVRPVCPSEMWSDDISVTINQESAILHVGEAVSLTATVRKGNEVVFYSPVTWTSDKPEIASVIAEGVVMAESVGSAMITASVQGKSATIYVEVEAAPAYDYVDLGLSVNWATFNVGASRPEGSGVFYAWGETEPKENYSWSTYKWCNGSSKTLTKYNKDSGYGTLDNKTVLDPEDDVAHVKWGDSWRMPTKAEWDELLNNCTWTWYVSGNTEFGGVPGYKVTSNLSGYTDRYIFLPAAGGRSYTSLYNVGSYGNYWSSSLSTYYPHSAYELEFNLNNVRWYNLNRDYGLSVRPVCPSETWANTISSVTIDQGPATLHIGETISLTATVCKGDEVVFFPVTWTSDKPEIASVSADGVVTAKAVGNAKITASVQGKSATIYVEVEPHPLDFILGELTARGESYFNGNEEWTVTFSKDPDGDLSKVWIKNLVNKGSSASSPVYGLVNEEKNLLSIPVGQTIAFSSSYSSVTLEGFRGTEADERIEEGDNIYADIAPDGTITIRDWFGSNIEHRNSWYNIYLSGVTLSKSTNISVTLDRESATLHVGEVVSLTATVLNGNDVVNYTVTWTSDKPEIASASSDGVVTAKAVGKAKITATVQGKSASCVIEVTESSSSEYEYVDLGLSVNWATFNVGASKPEENGSYFAWGETEQKDDYSYSTYKWCNGTYNSLTKYNTKSDYGTVDNKTVLDPEDDVAHVKWGGSWRMPTAEEQEELSNNCTWTWYDSGNTEFNGVAGYKVTSNKDGYTDRFIFLPAVGFRNDAGLRYGGPYGRYWSSSLNTGNPSVAYYLIFYSGSRSTRSAGRDYGFSVRPVCPSETWSDNISVTLDRESATLLVGKTLSLTATVLNGKDVVNYPVTWTSDKPEIASASSDGVVTAKAVGKAKITATVQGKSASCVIEVTESSSSEYEYVDLGLSVNWATLNVGASKPEEYGIYYAWGETEPKRSYSWRDYKFNSGGSTINYVMFSKYNTSSDYGTVDNKTVLDPEDDVAHVKWGGSWRMPTAEEWDELRNNCTWTWYDSGNTEFNGVAGYKVTSNKDGYTDRSIFLPAVGYRGGTSLHNGGSHGGYWSSSLVTDDPYSACSLFFDSGGRYAFNNYRYGGFSVRPVCP